MRGVIGLAALVGCAPGPSAPPAVPRDPSVTTCGRVLADVTDDAPSWLHLTPDVVARPIRARARSFEACFQHAEQRGELVSTARFTIAEDGRVADVEVRGAIAGIDDCLCRELATLRYPDLAARTTATYSFTFDAR